MLCIHNWFYFQCNIIKYLIWCCRYWNYIPKRSSLPQPKSSWPAVFARTTSNLTLFSCTQVSSTFHTAYSDATRPSVVTGLLDLCWHIPTVPLLAPSLKIQRCWTRCDYYSGNSSQGPRACLTNRAPSVVLLFELIVDSSMPHKAQGRPSCPFSSCR